MGKYAYSNGTHAASNCFKSKYTQYTFLRTSINNWKRKFNNQKEDWLPPIFNKRGRHNLVRDDLLQKIKEVVIGARLSGAVISRKMVISIGKGVLKANDPNNLREFRGHTTLTDDDWARSILQSMDWVKRKGTTGKIELSPNF